MDLQDKVAWITGGARMGLAIGRILSLAGCRIVLTYRESKKSALDTLEELHLSEREGVALRCDLGRRADIDRVVRQIEKQFGGLHILVQMASVYENGAFTDRGGLEIWKEHEEAHANSTLWTSIATAPLMKRSGGGRMIHISDWTSASGRPRYRDYGPYYVSKLMVKGLVESLALELAPHILVNAIAPGPILPPPNMSRKEQEDVKKATPLARWGGPEEIAKTVLFLAQTDFVTGETIRVDGGRHLL